MPPTKNSATPTTSSGVLNSILTEDKSQSISSDNLSTRSKQEVGFAFSDGGTKPLRLPARDGVDTGAAVVTVTLMERLRHLNVDSDVEDHAGVSYVTRIHRDSIV